MIQNHIGSSETTREPPFYSFDFANYIKYHRPEHKIFLLQFTFLNGL